MADILVSDAAFVQNSSAPTVNFDHLVNGAQIQSSAQACIVDLSAPSFAGIAALSNGAKGQLKVSWAAASDPTPPIRYEVYVKANTASGLFSSINLAAITANLNFDVFALADGTLVQSGVVYYVGVRAIDGVGNRDGNVVSLNVLSTGITGSEAVYEPQGAFVVNNSNQLQGTIWITKNGVLPSVATLGTASYKIYDKSGAAVVGMAETGLTPDVNGQYKITPISASGLSESLDHYVVKIGVVADSVERADYVPLIQKEPEYDINGSFHINSSQQLDGAFWVTADENIRTTGLGTGAIQVYDQEGLPVVGMSQSGITADANGIFKVSALASLLGNDYIGYSVKMTVMVDGISRSEIVPLYVTTPVYEAKAQFSINALNQFQATFWLTVNDSVKTGAGLGTASYTVYDASGNAVSGLTQSGISADANGRYQITPVSAALLTDLTHYSVKVAIIADGVERVAYKGFTLLGN